MSRRFRSVSVGALALTLTTCQSSPSPTAPRPDSSAPSPVVSPSPFYPNPLLFCNGRWADEEGSIYPVGCAGPMRVSGRLVITCDWSPGPPAGQVHIFVTRTPDPWACWYDPNCSEAIARSIGPEHPKTLELDVRAEDYLYVRCSPPFGSGPVKKWGTAAIYW
jgi:hypothetical protein